MLQGLVNETMNVFIMQTIYMVILFKDYTQLQIRKKNIQEHTNVHNTTVINYN